MRERLEKDQRKTGREKKWKCKSKQQRLAEQREQYRKKGNTGKEIHWERERETDGFDRSLNS